MVLLLPRRPLRFWNARLVWPRPAANTSIPTWVPALLISILSSCFSVLNTINRSPRPIYCVARQQVATRQKAGHRVINPRPILQKVSVSSTLYPEQGDVCFMNWETSSLSLSHSLPLVFTLTCRLTCDSNYFSSLSSLPTPDTGFEHPVSLTGGANLIKTPRPKCCFLIGVWLIQLQQLHSIFPIILLGE